jgi:hypothetical protein
MAAPKAGESLTEMEGDQSSVPSDQESDDKQFALGDEVNQANHMQQENVAASSVSLVVSTDDSHDRDHATSVVSSIPEDISYKRLELEAGKRKFGIGLVTQLEATVLQNQEVIATRETENKVDDDPVETLDSKTTAEG